MKDAEDRVSVGPWLDLALSACEGRLLACRSKLREVSEMLGEVMFVLEVLANREVDRLVKEDSDV